uniref:Uncharacterized protein n=1 Tax=Escherichia coli TaxID=562 RepID=I3W2A3_ECOLX|nr:hypothetical protein [Escherichia coli]
MSRSSSLWPVDAVATSGSSAIPQTGQLPGPLRRISGCIGHVHTPSDIAFSLCRCDGSTLSGLAS